MLYGGADTSMGYPSPRHRDLCSISNWRRRIYILYIKRGYANPSVSALTSPSSTISKQNQSDVYQATHPEQSIACKVPPARSTNMSRPKSPLRSTKASTATALPSSLPWPTADWLCVGTSQCGGCSVCSAVAAPGACACHAGCFVFPPLALAVTTAFHRFGTALVRAALDGPVQ